eukprot:1422383-Lingulodinium_polyedra.AAC.1
MQHQAWRARLRRVQRAHPSPATNLPHGLHFPPELPVLKPAPHHKHSRGAGMVRDEAREARGLGRALLVHGQGR